MLLRLHASNFQSIDAPVEFSMLASKESQHLDRVAKGDDLPARVLQAAAIWGANASGKSNFCRMLKYVQYLVVTGTRFDGPTGRAPFRLREAAGSEPSRAEFDILVLIDGEERIFRYTFAVTAHEVVEESLVELLTVSEKTYFTRKASKGGGNPVFELDWWERRAVPEEERQFARFVAKGTNQNQLFLHEAMDRNLTLLAPIFRWFRDQLVVLEPHDDFHSLEIQESGRQELRDYTAALLSRADTGITSVEAVEVPVSAMGMPKSLQDNLLASMKEEEGGVFFRSSSGGDRFSVFLKKGELIASRIVTFRESKEGRQVLFETQDESDGTLRLLDLAPVFHDLEVPGCRRVYVIDELDRSMHTQLTEALLRQYCDTRSKNTRTQLIFTTHDTMLMDQDLLRRDEMWFIERGKGGDTMLESLSDYKDVRYDKDVRKAYLEGRFSGLPHLRPFVRRTTPVETSKEEESLLFEDPAAYTTTKRRKKA